MKVLPQTWQLYAREGKLPGGMNRFERDRAGPGQSFVLAQLRREGIRIVAAWFGVKVLEHNMDRDDIERIGLGLRFISKFDDPLHDLELTDLDCWHLGWGLLSLRRRGRL
ncbi:MAG: hypothetical protein JW395_2284 [Nitrospira sp.]|nr:hypothetical protein [Nitrospira sp.]